MRVPFIVLFLALFPFLGGCFIDLDERAEPQPPSAPPTTCGDDLQDERIQAFLRTDSDANSVLAFGPAKTVAPLVASELCLSVQIPTCVSSWQLSSVTLSTTQGFETLDFANRPGDGKLGSSRRLCVPAPPADTVLNAYTATITHIRSGKVVERQGTLLDTPIGLDAFSLAVDATGGLWMGTVRHGLLGVNGSAVSHFPGVVLSAPFDPTFDGPQANAVTALLADASGESLWVGSFITGVSRLDLATHRWRHFDLAPGETMMAGPVGPIELAQTPFALLQDGVDTLWVGTGNGLYHMTVGTSDSATFQRATDGVIVAMDSRLNTDGKPQEIWLGHTTQATPSAEDAPFWPKQFASLTVVHPDESDRAAVAEFSLAVPGEVVLSLLVTDTYAFVGTDEGLFRAELAPGEATSPGTSLKKVTLAATGQATAVITALADDGAGGAWVGVAFECEADGGALLHVHADGSVSDHSAPTGVDRDVAALLRLEDGTLVVSTNTLNYIMGTPLTSCQPEGSTHRGDVYLVTPDGLSGADWEPLR